MDDQKVIFFFMFAVGFLTSFLRSLCQFASQIQGNERRSDRVKIALTMHRRYLTFGFAIFIFCTLLLSTQKVELWVILLGALVITCGSLDFDILRAALGKPPHFTFVFAVGNGLSVTYLLLSGGGVSSGTVAVLVPWIVLSVYVVYIELRVHRRNLLFNQRKVFPRATLNWTAASLTALYDGVVLNLPFLAGRALSAGTAVDLSVALRMYSSSTAFFPLLAHWINAGRLVSLAKFARLHVEWLYAFLLVTSGVAASGVFILLYWLAGGKTVSLRQFSLFVVVLFGIAAFFATARFTANRIILSHRIWQVAMLLILYVSVWNLLMAVFPPNAWGVIGLQFMFLVAFSASTLWLSLRRNSETRPTK